MAGTKRPDYGPVIDICTAASLRELATPALLAVLTPVIIGFGINYLALGAFLAAVILTGAADGQLPVQRRWCLGQRQEVHRGRHEGGKGSEAHKAAVIGDTVGDPFKDTAGPPLNPLIKVMNLVSLLTLPAIIKLQERRGPVHDRRTGARGADRRRGLPKRKGEAMDAGTPAATPVGAKA